MGSIFEIEAVFYKPFGDEQLAKLWFWMNRWIKEKSAYLICNIKSALLSYLKNNV